MFSDINSSLGNTILSITANIAGNTVLDSPNINWIDSGKESKNPGT